MKTVPLNFTRPEWIPMLEAGLRQAANHPMGPVRVKRQAIVATESAAARAVLESLRAGRTDIRLSLWAGEDDERSHARPLGAPPMAAAARLWFLRHDGQTPVCVLREGRPGTAWAFEPFTLRDFDFIARQEGFADSAEAETEFFSMSRREDVFGGLLLRW